jgi:AcrR family transcriptional regulator
MASEFSETTIGGNENRQAYHHGDLRASLIAAALLLIERHGVKNFSLKDAAAAAGVSTAAPYRHFADKDALLDALKNEGFSRFDAALTEAYEREATPGSRIIELGVAYLRFAMQHAAYFRVMFGLVRRPYLQPPPEQGDGFLLLVKAVKELMPQATPGAQKDMVLASWSLVHGFALLQIEGVFEGTVEIDGAEEQLRRILYSMLNRTVLDTAELDTAAAYPGSDDILR